MTSPPISRSAPAPGRPDPPPSAGARASHGSLLAIAVALSWAGLAVSALLAYRHAHPAAAGFCGAGSACDRILSSRYAEILGVPLAIWGALAYAALLGGYLVAYGLRAGSAYRVLLRACGVLGLLATLASGLLLYVQVGVLRALCPLCTLSAFLAAGIYLVGARIPRDAAAAPQPGRAGLLATGLVLASLVVAALVVLQRESRVIARIDGEEITADDLEREMQLSLYAHENQSYEAKKAWIDRKLTDRMLAAEAGRRGLSQERLLAETVDSETEVTDAEIDEWLARRPPDLSEEEKRSRVRRAIVAQRREKRLDALVASLRDRHRVEVLLPVPFSPQVPLDVSSAPSEGPAGAPVRLVVFSEFQCPFCAKLAATLRRVRERYPTEVSLAFLHWPLDAHDRSEPAAVAAQCASLQGAFWPYHDRLFREPLTLDDATLVEHARATGLDVSRFEACRREPDAVTTVRAHRRQAQDLGITAVPTLFLNGRHVGGALEYSELTRLVERELAGGGPAGPSR